MSIPTNNDIKQWLLRQDLDLINMIGLREMSARLALMDKKPDRNTRWKSGNMEVLQPYVSQICGLVDNLLDPGEISDYKGLVISTEKGGYSHLKPDGTLVLRGNMTFPSFVSPLAHEYTHHVQTEVLGDEIFEHPDKYKSLYEGHARAVEKVVADEFVAEFRDKSFLDFYYYCFTPDLELVRSWYLREHGLPRDDLLSEDADKPGYVFYRNYEPTHYAFGNVAFSLLREQQGDEVLKKVIQGENVFRG
jgi:hypothetical protein